MVLAYCIIAGLLLLAGWASAPRPRSVALITLAVLAWPLTMMAIAFQVYVLEPSRRPHVADDESDTFARGLESPAVVPVSRTTLT